MKHFPASALFAALLGASVWGYVRWTGAAEPSSTHAFQAAPQQGERFGPGPEPVDRWHPERERPVQPAYGGTLTIHVGDGLPPSLNHALLNNANSRYILNELNATLLRRDWESWEFEGELAAGWDVADTLVARDGRVLHGLVTEEEGQWVVAGQPVPEDQVERVERGTVFTFHLRAGVTWHDGHPFDAGDVLFSWQISKNPEVRCDWVRPYLARIERAEALDAHTVRFFFREQYFNSRSLFADNFCVLPRHLYDLRDPDHPRHRADASDAECAREINENPHNTQWVGLGPYRLTSYSSQGVEAERFEGFFDPEQGGYADRIVWRSISNDTAAFQALLNGELDFSVRLSSEQYFGEATQQEAFTRRYCKGYYYLGSFNYVPWNMRRPILSDLRVRKALAHALDLPGYVETVAHGLAVMPTGPQCYFGPAYNRHVARLEHDPEKATELFAEAGWYDRDGDRVLDKDGQPFEIEMLITSGNVSSEIFTRMYQESLARVGVRLKVTALDNATYWERIRERDFDAGGGGGWTVDATENDPVQLWSSGAAAKGGSNHAGVIDARVDALIAEGQRELDDERRWGLWRELHRYLYEEVQPYLYREAPPRKFALNTAIRGVQFFKLTPGYSLRRWFYPAGTPGTRSTRELPAGKTK
jgi:peptide/nickel transport system substrate-binding protein